MKKIFISLLVVLALPVSAEDAAIPVLLISGQNNHNWVETTPLIVESLEAAVRFDVEVVNDFEAFPPESLEEFAVILSNWNLWKHRHDLPGELDWSPQLREAYVDFVKNGKGHVALHAGSSTFFDWAEYQEICVATWKSGTHHGPQHEFDVRIDQEEHPITRGLGSFRKWDELWENVYVTSENATVLTSSFAAKEFGGDDVWEPSTFVSRFGEGRTAYTSFGHSAKSFESPAFRVLLARLVEWAATGEVTIEACEP
ncbi:MAG: ThuA domain-containing protein [Planctomycetota bacterium]